MFCIRNLQIIFVLLFASVLTGCATHGEVNIPVKVAVDNPEFRGKVFSSEVLYSQPEPGVFSEGKQLPLKPIENAQVSVGASRVLSRFKELFMRQLPAEASLGAKENSDYTFTVELYAKDKKGPSFADFDLLASTGKSLLTLGLGSSEYTIIADFDVIYKIKDSDGNTLHEKSFSVFEEVDHEKGKLDGFDVGDDLAAKLLEKHIVLTMNDFFSSTIQS